MSDIAAPEIRQENDATTPEPVVKPISIDFRTEPAAPPSPSTADQFLPGLTIIECGDKGNSGTEPAFTLEADDRSNLALLAQNGNDAALRILQDTAPNRPDSVLASVLTTMKTNPEFAPAVQAAALRSYTEGTDAPFLSLISDAAQVDSTFRNDLKEFVAETLQTGTAQDRASAMRIMAAVAQHWNSEDLDLVFSNLSAVDVELFKEFLPQDQRDDFEQLLAADGQPTWNNPLLPAEQDERLPGEALGGSDRESYPSDSQTAEQHLRDVLQVARDNLTVQKETEGEADTPLQLIDIPARALTDSSYLSFTSPGLFEPQAKPVETVFERMGATTSGAASQARIAFAETTYGSQTLLAVEQRVAMFNALPADIRRELSGSEQQIDRQQVAGKLLNGTLTSADEQLGFLLDEECPLEERMQALREEATARMHSTEVGLVQLNQSRESAYETLDELTRNGPGFVARMEEVALFPLSSGLRVPQYAREQAEMVADYTAQTEAYDHQVSLIVSDAQRLAQLELAQDAGVYTRLNQADDTVTADYFAVAMASKHGSEQMQTVTPEIYSQLTAPDGALSRLHDAGLARHQQLPEYSADENQRYAQALSTLSAITPDDGASLDLPAYRQQALEVLDQEAAHIRLYHGEFVNAGQLSAQVAVDLAEVTKLFQTGMEGAKFDAFSAEARERVESIRHLFVEMGPNQVLQLQTHLDSLRAAEEAATDGPTKMELQSRRVALEQTIELFDPNSETRKALDPVLDMVKGRTFDADDFGNLLRENGPEIAVAIAAAAAAIAAATAAATIVATTLGIGTPAAVALLAATAGSISAATAQVAGVQVTREVLHVVNHNIADTGLGRYEQQSHLMEWADAHGADFQQLFGADSLNEAVSAEVKLVESFLGDVVGPLAMEVAVSSLIMLATAGVVKLSSSAIRAIAPGAMRSALAGPQAAQLAQAVTKSPEAKHFLRSWLVDSGHEGLEEAVSMVGEEGADAALSAMGMDGSAASVLVSLTIAMANGKVGGAANNDIPKINGHNEISVNTEALGMYVEQLRADGHTVVEGADGTVIVTPFDNPEAQVIIKAAEPAADWQSRLNGLAQSNDLQQLASFATEVPDLQLANKAVDLIAYQHAPEMMGVLREIAEGDSYATSAALQWLYLDADGSNPADAQHLEFVQERIRSGSFMDMWNRGLVDPEIAIGIAERGVDGYVEQVSHSLSDPDALAGFYNLVFKNKRGDEPAGGNPDMTSAGRRLALRHMVETDPAGATDTLLKLARSSNDADLRQDAVDALYDKWTHEADLTNTPVLAADRLQRFVDNARTPWENVSADSANPSLLHDDYTQLGAELEAQQVELFEHIEDAKITGVAEASMTFHNDADMRRLLKGHPQLLSRYEAIRAEEAVHTEMRQELDGILEARAKQLEEAAEQLCHELGIPPIQIKFFERLAHSNKSGQYDGGTNTTWLLESQALSASVVPGADLIDILAHELTHAEQDALRIRHLADDLHITEAATPEQRSELAARYKEATGDELDPAYMDAVIELRRGEPLWPEQEARAAGLLEREQTDQGRVQGLRQELAMLTDDTPLEVFLGEGYGEKDLVLQRLGTDKMPADLADAIGNLRATRRPSPEHREARAEFIATYRNHLQTALRAESGPAYGRYRASKEEVESFEVGRRAGFFAEHQPSQSVTDRTYEESHNVGQVRRTNDVVEMRPAMRFGEDILDVAVEQRQVTVNGHDVVISTPTNALSNRRDITIDGRTIELRASNSWMMSNGHSDSNSQVKLHITALDRMDCASVQVEMLPLLEALRLEGLVDVYKTFDFNYIDRSFGGRFAPGPTGQGCKSFTVYVKPEHIQEVARIIDDRLLETRLSLDPETDTNTVGDYTRGDLASGRVTLERDSWAAGEIIRGDLRTCGAVLDQQLVDALRTRYATNADGTFSRDTLFEIENGLGIYEAQLRYDTMGRLTFSDLNNDAHQFWTKHNVYVQEGGADRQTGLLTGRQAMYRLYDEFGLDPVEVAVENAANGIVTLSAEPPMRR